jgi:hypothetical protein
MRKSKMPTAKVPESATLDRTTVALEKFALYPTRLAMARWASVGDLSPLHGNDSLPLRAAYYAQAQRDFQAWLDRGGFRQSDQEPAGETDLVDPTLPDGEAQSANCCAE